MLTEINDNQYLRCHRVSFDLANFEPMGQMICHNLAGESDERPLMVSIQPRCSDGQAKSKPPVGIERQVSAKGGRMPLLKLVCVGKQSSKTIWLFDKVNLLFRSEQATRGSRPEQTNTVSIPLKVMA